MDRASPRELRAGIERLILWHMWACVPFAIPWMIWPERFGHPSRPEEAAAMRLLFLIVGLSFVLRTWVILKRVGGLPWPYLWPLLDVGFITAAGQIGDTGPDSWLILVYILPVLQAAATLDLRWSIGVALLGALSCGWIEGLENLRYSYFAFRLGLLVLFASFVTTLARGLVRARSRLELANYRSELSAEMHDGLQQYLSALALQGSSLGDKPPGPLIRETASKAADELRIMLHRLRMASSSEATLPGALREVVSLFAQRSEAHLELKLSGEPRPLPTKLEHALLRIAQEALHNVAKHAKAENVLLELAYGPNDVQLRIEDDGIGFSPSAAEGMGMETIRNRAASHGGTVQVGPGESGGARVSVALPTSAREAGKLAR
jgi:signal transduction histidine kinase